MEKETVKLPTVQSFEYLGSMVDRKGGASKNVDSRVANTLSKWRYLTGVICNKKVPTKTRLLIYQIVIRLTLLYGCETWPVSVKDENRDGNGAMGNGGDSPVARMTTWKSGKVQGFLMVLGSHDITDEI